MDRQRRILWIDSEIDELQSHILFLEHNGYFITTATSDSEGMSILESETCDAVLLDHKMPEMDGIRVLSKIKKSHPHLPVVIVTGSDQKHVMSAAIIHAVDDFLIKPVSPKQIASVLTFVFDHGTIKQDYT
ncbi:MAG: response regulator, partial [Candidatus Poribacteria bacterium]|nr:response regulator [Candidatus Poribacteria bacterium]